MKWYHTLFLWCFGVSFICHQLATVNRFNELRELALSSQVAIIHLRKAADTEIFEVTTPDGRYTIKVERPKDGLLEMYIHEPEDTEPHECEPAPEPGEMIWPGRQREIFNTDLVL